MRVFARRGASATPAERQRVEQTRPWGGPETRERGTRPARKGGAGKEGDDPRLLSTPAEIQKGSRGMPRDAWGGPHRGQTAEQLFGSPSSRLPLWHLAPQGRRESKKKQQKKQRGNSAIKGRREDRSGRGRGGEEAPSAGKGAKGAHTKEGAKKEKGEEEEVEVEKKKGPGKR